MTDLRHGLLRDAEITTCPPGQGLAAAVGVAMGLERERARRDPDADPGESPFDRTVWVLASESDLQEGPSYEAGALAGRHRLGNLVVVHAEDDAIVPGRSEDVVMRFVAQGWFVQRFGPAPGGGVNIPVLDRALAAAATHRCRPSLVVVAGAPGVSADIVDRTLLAVARGAEYRAARPDHHVEWSDAVIRSLPSAD